MAMIQYRILKFSIDHVGQIVRLQNKLPINLKVCSGYIARISKGVGLPVDLPEVGLISLEFNSKKELAVNDVVGYECQYYAKPEYQQLEVQLEKGGIVNCVYIDKYPTYYPFSPYTVSVYLKCKTTL